MIPVGVENAKIREWPVVTLAIAVTCVLFTLLGLGGSNTGPSFEDVYQVYADGVAQGMFWLDVPEACVPSVSDQADLQAAHRAAVASGIPELGNSAPDFIRSQQQIDQLCDWVQSSNPLAAYGVVPSRGAVQLGWITHLVVHKNPLHLALNLTFLLLLGGAVLEDELGKLVYTAIFVVGGLLTALGLAALDWQSGQAILGASGAIGALMGALWVRFPKKSIWLGASGVRLPTLAVLVGWVALNSVLHLVALGDSPLSLAVQVAAVVFGGLIAAALGLMRQDGGGKAISSGAGREALRQDAVRLGVPISALEEPDANRVHPDVRDMFQDMKSAFKEGDEVLGTQRARWVFERAEFPRDDKIGEFTIARYADQLDPEVMSAPKLRRLISFANRHELYGPKVILEQHLARISDRRKDPDAPPEPAANDPHAPAVDPVQTEPERLAFRLDGDDNAGGFAPPPPQAAPPPAPPPPGPPPLPDDEDTSDSESQYYREFDPGPVREAAKERKRSARKAAPPEDPFGDVTAPVKSEPQSGLEWKGGDGQWGEPSGAWGKPELPEPAGAEKEDPWSMDSDPWGDVTPSGSDPLAVWADGLSGDEAPPTDEASLGGLPGPVDPEPPAPDPWGVSKEDPWGAEEPTDELSNAWGDDSMDQPALGKPPSNEPAWGGSAPIDWDDGGTRPDGEGIPPPMISEDFPPLPTTPTPLPHAAPPMISEDLAPVQASPPMISGDLPALQNDWGDNTESKTVLASAADLEKLVEKTKTKNPKLEPWDDGDTRVGQDPTPGRLEPVPDDWDGS